MSWLYIVFLKVPDNQALDLFLKRFFVFSSKVQANQQSGISTLLRYPDRGIQQNYFNGPADEIFIKYFYNTTPKRIQVVLTLPDFRMLNDDELAQVWQTAKRLNKEYEALSFDRKAFFGVPSPGVYTEGLHFEKYVKLDSYTYIDDFSEDGKQDFLQEYREDWALLDSGLPVRD